MSISTKQPHKHLKSSVARLMAVQALYSSGHNEAPLRQMVHDYLERYSEMEVEGERLAPPDKRLFSSILQGVEERRVDLQDLIAGALQKDGEAAGKPLEPLLQSIVLCGAYELMAHHDVDAPIIMNDYLDITHSFYGQSEAGLVNGILDKLKTALRA